jgi:hypothetical protein
MRNLIAINRSPISHTSNACLTFSSFDGGFLPFRSVSSNTWRAIPSPHVSEIRPGWYERIQTVPNKEARRILLRGLLRFASMGAIARGDATGATADEYGQTG